jgi:hypothetical protein
MVPLVIDLLQLTLLGYAASGLTASATIAAISHARAVMAPWGPALKSLFVFLPGREASKKRPKNRNQSVSFIRSAVTAKDVFSQLFEGNNKTSPPLGFSLFLNPWGDRTTLTEY